MPTKRTAKTRRKTRRKPNKAQKGGCACRRRSQRGAGVISDVGDYIYENPGKVAAGLGAAAWLGLGVLGNMPPTPRTYTSMNDPYGGTLLSF